MHLLSDQEFHRLVEEAVLDERKRCALIARTELVTHGDHYGCWQGLSPDGEQIAEAILRG